MAASNFIKSLYFLSKKIFFPVTLRGIPKHISIQQTRYLCSCTNRVHHSVVDIEIFDFCHSCTYSHSQVCMLKYTIWAFKLCFYLLPVQYLYTCFKSTGSAIRPAAQLVLMPIRIATPAFLRFVASFFRKSSLCPFHLLTFPLSEQELQYHLFQQRQLQCRLIL